MNIYNWLNFGVQSIQKGHPNRPQKTQTGYNSANYTYIKLKLGVVVLYMSLPNRKLIFGGTFTTP